MRPSVSEHFGASGKILTQRCVFVDFFHCCDLSDLCFLVSLGITYFLCAYFLLLFTSCVIQITCCVPLLSLRPFLLRRSVIASISVCLQLPLCLSSPSCLSQLCPVCPVCVFSSGECFLSYFDSP